MIDWFMCYRDGNEHGKVCALAAAASSAAYGMRRYFVYDGDDEPFLESLRAKAPVTVLRHRFSLGDEMVRAGRGQFLGHYLRTDIPEIIADHGLDVECYLYTDCDVIFLADPNCLPHRPKLFAAAAEKVELTHYFNSGVLWCNAAAMLQTLGGFRKHMVDHGFRWTWGGVADQGAMNSYYRGDREHLSIMFNWRPYWQPDPGAVILHWHTWVPGSGHPVPDRYLRAFSELIRPAASVL